MDTIAKSFKKNFVPRHILIEDGEKNIVFFKKFIMRIF